MNNGYETGINGYASGITLGRGSQRPDCHARPFVPSPGVHAYDEEPQAGRSFGNNRGKPGPGTQMGCDPRCEHGREAAKQVVQGVDAIEPVCCFSDVPTAGALDLLSSLINKSLVIKEEADGAACYRLHETMWEYTRLRCTRRARRKPSKAVAPITTYHDAHASHRRDGTGCWSGSRGWRWSPTTSGPSARWRSGAGPARRTQEPPYYVQ
jgi:hypothetical protein